ncbi:Acyl-ligase [Hyphodiscus hymeniophilus]|uniref:Acyl-ligase n=1 Tax=Hyphodiscus hymeniophilus TaxID=353542 RepID=A0A9P6SK58_9HELO|nr:Acyl-ligase [Hyphodiscus hymeniophilus]
MYRIVKPFEVIHAHQMNQIYYPILFLGIVAAGGVFAGSNPSYTHFEISHHIKTAKAKFVISEPHILNPVLLAAQNNGITMSRIWIFDEFNRDVPSDMKSWRALLGHGEVDWLRFDDFQRANDTTAARLFSSGTTGLPKAASLSHYNIIAQHTLVSDANPRPYQIIRLIPLPLFHAAAAPVTHTSALRDGVSTYIMRRFELTEFLNHLQNYRITDLTLVPPIAIALIHSPLAQKSSLKWTKSAGSGAAPLDKSMQALLRAKLPSDAPCTQVFGMTEISCLGMLIPYPEDDDTGSIGKLIPGLEAKLVDTEGNEITQHDVRGEICFRGPTVIKGYFENETANRESFDQDGWFKTGDIGYCAKGSEKWYIVDRKKELIKVRGFQVAPFEIEGVLVSHPHIVDAAVIGVQLPGQEDEHPRAYLVKSSSLEAATLTVEEVKSFVASRLAKYKTLTGGVKFVEAIPKNASGKVLKKVIREIAKKEIGGEKPRL